MTLSVKSGGTWQEPSKVYVKNSGSWTEVKKVFVKSGGTWHEVYSSGPTSDPNIGENWSSPGTAVTSYLITRDESNGMWIADFYTGSSSVSMAYSIDGSSWSSVSLGIYCELYDVLYVNPTIGTILSGIYNYETIFNSIKFGKLWRSTNGTTNSEVVSSS
jgi:hypothetical protein